jgi:hypothetical protein
MEAKNLYISPQRTDEDQYRNLSYFLKKKKKKTTFKYINLVKSGVWNYATIMT